jgi:competence protein ComEC
MPDIAVIPVGRNSFGHPAAEVLERLERIGAAVYRTDEAGHVTVTNNN